ncbi:hypothetical protein ACN6LM_007287 [Streptomyces sp. SAS_281]|uniref:hypothetical protein n=1 Tax=Streptomyces sp. SAS_281 TaxID=3412744 RepID=UPI00403C71C1
MVRSSRKVIYGSYADECSATLDRFRQAYIEVALTVDMSEREAADSLSDLLASWRDPAENLDPLESAVRAEGPDSVVESALAASRALTRFGSVVLAAIEAKPAARERRVQLAKDAYGETYKCYIEFLYDAAECLGEEDFLRTRS